MENEILGWCKQWRGRRVISAAPLPRSMNLIDRRKICVISPYADGHITEYHRWDQWHFTAWHSRKNYHQNTCTLIAAMVLPSAKSSLSLCFGRRSRPRISGRLALVTVIFASWTNEVSSLLSLFDGILSKASACTIGGQTQDILRWLNQERFIPVLTVFTGAASTKPSSVMRQIIY